jgi:adenylosuccinate synthase
MSNNCPLILPVHIALDKAKRRKKVKKNWYNRKRE